MDQNKKARATARRAPRVLAAMALSATAALSVGTLTAAPASAASYPVLQLGSTGSAVVTVQKKLGVSPATGYYGTKTQAAVKRYQASHGIPTTGVVANLTWASLTKKPVKTTSSKPKRATRANVIAIARSLKGIPYRANGYSPSTGFNCSSYTQYVFSRVGINLGGAYTVTQYQRAKKIKKKQARPGDLVFFYNYPKNFLGHVGIYAGNGMMWAAPHTGDVVKYQKVYTKKVKYARVL